MPSLALVTQAGAPTSSATATLVEDYTNPGVGQQVGAILNVQAMPKLYFWVDVTVGGPVTIQPEFAIRGDTTPNNFDPDPLFLPLAPAFIHPGAGTGPILQVYEFPAIFIRALSTHPAVATTKIILAASV